MDGSAGRIVVVSAVNIRKGGTLTILKECLEYLSGMSDRYTVVAIVHRKELCDYPGIRYIEMPEVSRSWIRRLWTEYVTFHSLSLKIADDYGKDKVWTWLSLHDTTPRVVAEHREVYCQTSFPFMKVKFQDFLMDPKIGLFTLLTRWAYRINVHRNDCLIVQQNWFADAMSVMLGVPRDKFRVIPPRGAITAKLDTGAGNHDHAPVTDKNDHSSGDDKLDLAPGYIKFDSVSGNGSKESTFLYVSTADCHKNFETLCRAAKRLEDEIGKDKFKLVITVKGDENRYARFLKRNWGDCSSIDFHGLIPRSELTEWYKGTSCFIFPSRIETWGLPISEFLAVQPEGQMILADLPYAHETAGGRGLFFDPADYKKLARLMRELIN